MVSARLKILFVCTFFCFALAAAGQSHAASNDVVTDTVENIGDAFSEIFRELGDSIGRAGDDIERVITGRSRKIVDFDRQYKPGTIVISTNQRRLYLVTRRGQALRYSIGVGREGFQWGGKSHISRKAKWPSWRPPPEMLERQPNLPKYMEGGPENPLGARALYLGATLYRIHGTNEKHTIGGAVSSGCIRLLNEDVIDLYDRVKVGATVYVFHKK